MKKTVFFSLLFVWLIFGCTNQEVVAQSSNDAQRIVGTWAVEDGSITFIFNANGTFSVRPSDNEDRREGNYMVSNSRLLLRSGGASMSSTPTDYYLSADGRILSFSYTYYPREGASNRVSGFLWLIKQ